MTNNQNIRLLDIQAISDFSHSNPQGIAVIMPCIDSETGIKTAEILYQRAGISCTILVVMDTLRQGFIKTLNQTAARVTAKYIVYLAQDAWPGRGWLKCAYESLERSGKGLLAFNDGKWQGKIASFGMVRLSWVKTIYNGNVFFPGYRLHGADNELTEIARFQGVYQYNPECTLMEYDPDKDFGGSNPKDKALFEARLQQDFDGMTSMKRINDSAEQNITSISPSEKAHNTLQKGVSIIIPTLNGARHLDKLLSSFFRINTFSPLEFIIIDHGSTDNTFDILKKYMTKGFVRLIKRDQNYSFSDSCNLGAQKARYPYLLFLNNDIIYISDVLPKALRKLDLDQGIGAVGLRLDDDPDSLVPGEEQKIQHLGIEFKWNARRGYYQPEQIRHPSLKEFLSSLATDQRPMTSGCAITAAVMLVRKLDFEKLNGFSTEYTYGLEDIDFCLRLRRDLQKKCFCIIDMGLQHVEGATRKDWYNTERSKIIENNHRIFKQKWNEYIREKFIHRQQTKDPKAKKQSNPAVHSETFPEEPQVHKPQSTNNNALNILFILLQDLDCNNGYQVKLLARMFQAQGANCTIAVPELSDEQRAMSKEPSSSFNLTSDLRPLTSVVSYSSLLTDHASRLTSYDAIHAWTPREIVRKFTEKILAKQSCPLIIHLEDNEEYLTEVTVGKPFADLRKMPQAELDKLIPKNRYHPIRGREFLDQAQGLTMVIDTLNRFNTRNVPYQIVPPMVDERLFYPRPINRELRRKHKIPDDSIALVYTGNVHAGNVREVEELYKAVSLLNEQGRPTVLLRTGKDLKTLAAEARAAKKHEIHLGWVKREELPDILAAADIFVQPGEPGPFNDERIPCKLPEFFAMGRPVVLPRTNLGLMMEHGLEGYVLDKADAEGIAGAVDMILNDAALKEKLAVGSLFFYQSKIYQTITRLKVDLYVRHTRST